ncbi:hypothetical protein IV203_029765 [Nitzschia inconspicua]|uniref:Uncharacterized protein n=1 Tax=Nitzschia inconspicua TaxID=303405 RepID=A0A9K3P8W9_9STRA|nr:hypothetical protein IV203_004847 [Nitzschia inconspicua]KAG7367095.1 hypothetical protein IV203_029765 [Nitzschia inconspicua]
MRLYDQASGTPSQSSSSLDRKKWIRPKGFLPNPNEVTAILTKQTTTKEEHLPATAKDLELVPIPVAPKCKEQPMPETTFLFDIDEESSMNSISTMSTHTSFQRDFPGGGRLGLAKSFPEVKIETVHEESPFEVLHATSVEKTKTRSLRSWNRRQESCKTHSPKGGSMDEISYATRETEAMTLTESSSDESPWAGLTFDDDFESHPFHETPQSGFLTQEAKRNATASPGYSSRGNTQNLSHDFTKYSAMMIRGRSVAEVTKVMAQDHVHPSIISLVMIAASENHQ